MKRKKRKACTFNGLTRRLRLNCDAICNLRKLKSKTIINIKMTLFYVTLRYGKFITSGTQTVSKK